jgi:hypothetical protein
MFFSTRGRGLDPVRNDTRCASRVGKGPRRSSAVLFDDTIGFNIALEKSGTRELAIPNSLGFVPAKGDLIGIERSGARGRGGESGLPQGSQRSP